MAGVEVRSLPRMTFWTWAAAMPWTRLYRVVLRKALFAGWGAGPLRAVFLTDGNARRVQLGKRQIILKHTTPRNVATAGRNSGLVIQALRWLGKKHVDDKIINR